MASYLMIGSAKSETVYTFFYFVVSYFISCFSLTIKKNSVLHHLVCLNNTFSLVLAVQLGPIGKTM